MSRSPRRTRRHEPAAQPRQPKRKGRRHLINSCTFAITLAGLAVFEFSGTLARAYQLDEAFKVPAALEVELTAITADVFTLPDVPAPPPPAAPAAGTIVTHTKQARLTPAPGLPDRATAAAISAMGVALDRRKQARAKRTPRRDILGTMEFRTNPRGGGVAWQQAMQRLDNELPLYSFCETGALKCPERFSRWRKVVAEVRHLKGKAQLAAINKRINDLVAYSEDPQIFGRKDYWATPLEFLDAGGDCEDFTILKFASLVELGWDERDLRIVVVRDKRRKVGHAVLAVNTADGEMILDSLSDKVRGNTGFKHYLPVYSLNREQHWLHVKARRVASR